MDVQQNSTVNRARSRNNIADLAFVSTQILAKEESMKNSSAFLGKQGKSETISDFLMHRAYLNKPQVDSDRL
jgi:hypothetical protein